MVGIDGAKFAILGSKRNLMLESMARQGCMIGFEVKLEVVLQPILLQKPKGGCCVKIILMGGGFPWLWFDQQLEGGSDLFLVYGRGREG